MIATLLYQLTTALVALCLFAWALAIPTAFAANIGRMAHFNIMARGGEPLENVQDIKNLILDKTGTFTMAEPEVSQIMEIKMPQRKILELAASIESRFDHPIARSIISFAKNRVLYSIGRSSMPKISPAGASR